MAGGSAGTLCLSVSVSLSLCLSLSRARAVHTFSLSLRPSLPPSLPLCVFRSSAPSPAADLAPLRPLRGAAPVAPDRLIGIPTALSRYAYPSGGQSVPAQKPSRGRPVVDSWLFLMDEISFLFARGGHFFPRRPWTVRDDRAMTRSRGGPAARPRRAGCSSSTASTDGWACKSW